MKKALLFLSSLFLFCACATIDEPFSQRDSGRSITVERGDKFEVRLVANTARDARWVVVSTGSVLKQLSSKEPEAWSVTGGLARLYAYTFVFKAEQVGEGTLRLELKDGSGSEPEETFTLDIRVE